MKKKMPKSRIIFSNYDTSDLYEETKQFLIDESENEEDYEPSDDEIWNRVNAQLESDWKDAKEDLVDFIERPRNKYYKRKWLLMGSIGRWNGVFRAGTVFDDFMKMFYQATKDCHYWKFYDENGHLYLTCSHHDGTCHFEIKEITDVGIDYLERWEENWDDKRSESYIHNMIFNKYSRLPRFVETVYGLPKTEYEPVTKTKLIDVMNNQAKSFYSIA